MNNAANAPGWFLMGSVLSNPMRNGFLAAELSGMGFHKIEGSEIFEKALIVAAIIIFAGYVWLFNL
jgi:hypothetical protein